MMNTAFALPARRGRLPALFFASIAFFGIVASAAYSLSWVVQDMRAERRSGVAGITVQPDVQLPDGVIAIQRVADERQFEELAGFAPFVPERVPGTTDGTVSLGLTLPDEQGRRAGRVGFSPGEGAGVDGITGPMIVIFEVPGEPGAGVDGELQRITTGTGRALAAALQCGDLVLDVQLYFGPDPADGEPFITPYMTSVAEEFLAGVRAQCGGRR
jgi:hypothetical protein